MLVECRLCGPNTLLPTGTSRRKAHVITFDLFATALGAASVVAAPAEASGPALAAFDVSSCGAPGDVVTASASIVFAGTVVPTFGNESAFAAPALPKDALDATTAGAAVVPGDAAAEAVATIDVEAAPVGTETPLETLLGRKRRREEGRGSPLLADVAFAPIALGTAVVAVAAGLRTFRPAAGVVVAKSLIDFLLKSGTGAVSAAGSVSAFAVVPASDSKGVPESWLCIRGGATARSVFPPTAAPAIDVQFLLLKRGAEAVSVAGSVSAFAATPVSDGIGVQDL